MNIKLCGSQSVTHFTIVCVETSAMNEYEIEWGVFSNFSSSKEHTLGNVPQ